MRPLLVVLLLVLAGPPATASASVVRATGSCDRYNNCSYRDEVRAGAGEVNAITVTFAGPLGSDQARVRIRDDGAPVRVGGLCRSVDAHTAECPTSASVDVHAGDRDDRVDASDAPAGGVVLHGGSGTDHLIAAPGAGTLAGDAGLDTLEGGSAVDYSSETDGVRVDLAAQTARTSGGTERFAGIGSAVGGSGDDELIAGGPPSPARYLLGGAGDDRLIGDASPDTLGGGPGDDLLTGRDGDDKLSGGTGRDVQRGGPGDDVLGGYGDAPVGSVGDGPFPVDRDPLDCGEGSDTVEPADAPVILDLSCEELLMGRFPEARLSGSAVVVERSVLGPPARVRATVRLRGARRVERRLRFTVPASAGDFPPGVRRLDLDSRRIRARRRVGSVVVEVELRGIVPGLLGDGPDGDARYRSWLLIRLPGSTGPTAA